jgi:hypothetical protein
LFRVFWWIVFSICPQEETRRNLDRTLPSSIQWVTLINEGPVADFTA